ncbi:VOC family protein [Sphingomonas sp. 28-63-12]|uniref:VOC family protein n=1 Tax=Sphingomonas sp. 28-63-12 TaxID=1970434 RepID=UPI000BCEB663|nr:MAG: hypothetical protein B7Y47_01510 [Sphingomonas sp. 28-63-12]
MFARPHARHAQIAYVTNDLAAATALIERDYGAPGFWVFSTGAASGGDAEAPTLKIALARVGGVEIELIEPQGSSAPLFSDSLPAGADLAIVFHHVAFRIEGPLAHWDQHLASIDTARHKIVFGGAVGDDVRYCYTDERSAIGHLVEHVWMSPAILAQMAAAVPAYPRLT